ncbi:MAG: hypothetical protein DMF13_10315, partial [Verrucomicrobia bacterium]
DRDPIASGFEIYSLTPRGAPSTYEDGLTLASINIQNGSEEDAASVELSCCIYHSLLGQIGEFDRGIKRARFAVLRLTKIPAVLIEGGFLTERGESRLIANPGWRQQLADAICAGIDSYRALANSKKPPLVVADYRRQKPGAPAPQKDTLVDPAARRKIPPRFKHQHHRRSAPRQPSHNGKSVGRGVARKSAITGFAAGETFAAETTASTAEAVSFLTMPAQYVI